MVTDAVAPAGIDFLSGNIDGIDAGIFPIWLEQPGFGRSNPDLVGATRIWSEQLGFGRSSSDLVGAARIWSEQLGFPPAGHRRFEDSVRLSRSEVAKFHSCPHSSLLFY
jgi:hypothetical protein